MNLDFEEHDWSLAKNENAKLTPLTLADDAKFEFRQEAALPSCLAPNSATRKREEERQREEAFLFRHVQKSSIR